MLVKIIKEYGYAVVSAVGSGHAAEIVSYHEAGIIGEEEVRYSGLPSLEQPVLAALQAWREAGVEGRSVMHVYSLDAGTYFTIDIDLPDNREEANMTVERTHALVRSIKRCPGVRVWVGITSPSRWCVEVRYGERQIRIRRVDNPAGDNLFPMFYYSEDDQERVLYPWVQDPETGVLLIPTETVYMTVVQVDDLIHWIVSRLAADGGEPSLAKAMSMTACAVYSS